MPRQRPIRKKYEAAGKEAYGQMSSVLSGKLNSAVEGDIIETVLHKHSGKCVFNKILKTGFKRKYTQQARKRKKRKRIPASGGNGLIGNRFRIMN